MIRLHKQIIWSILLWQSICVNSWANTIEVKIIPESPTSNDSIEVVLSNLQVLDSKHDHITAIHSENSLNGNTLKIILFITISGPVIGIPPAGQFPITNHPEIITVGSLPSNNYSIEIYKSVSSIGGEDFGIPELIQNTDPFSVSTINHSIPVLSNSGVLLLTLLAGLTGIFFMKNRSYT